MEACRIAREYSTPVILLTDQAVSTRIEAFDEPDLPKIMVEPGADLSPRPADFKPYPLNALTRHAPPGSVGRLRQIPDRHRSRARRTRPSHRQLQAAHADDHQAPRENETARRHPPRP
jgi:pyruvate/2-oxoacid:ferredoxin oxidoreductase alpha subunit